MKSAKYIREAMHDLLCRSVDVCSFDPEYVPDERHAQERERSARARDGHARTRVFTDAARAFRKTTTEADGLRVLHDMVCTLGSHCERGPAHLNEKARMLVREWRS